MPFVKGEYEPADNILRLWHPQPMTLNQPAIIEQFFAEVVALIRNCPTRPFLLMNYTHLQIAAEMTQSYAAQVKAYRHLSADVFRYNLSADTEGVLTKVAILVANRTDANIFPDERSARDANRKARRSSDQPPA